MRVITCDKRVDGGDGPLVAHAGRADDADGADALAVAVCRRDHAERLKIRRRVFGADDDRQTEPVEPFEALAEQTRPADASPRSSESASRGLDRGMRRLGRRAREFVEEQRRALHVQRVVASDVGQARTAPGAARGRRARRTAPAPRASCATIAARTSSSVTPWKVALMKLAASVNSAEVERRLGVDRLVQDLPAGRRRRPRARAVSRASRSRCAAAGRRARWRDRKADVMRRAREFVRGVIEQVFHRAGPAQARFDFGRRPRRACAIRGACRRRAGSPSWSARGRRRCAAAAPDPAPRDGPGYCGPSPTTDPSALWPASQADDTGSPCSMYSATSRARIRRWRSDRAGSCMGLSTLTCESAKSV